MKSIIKNKISKLVISPYFLIYVVYFLCHWGLFMVSGVFWDDLCYETHDFERFKNIALMTGRPEWLFLIPFGWSLPNNSYRFLVFLLYGFQSVLFYKILLKMKFLDKKEALLISLVFIMILVNDAHMLLSNFTYAIGLTFFLFSIYIFYAINQIKYKK